MKDPSQQREPESGDPLFQSNWSRRRFLAALGIAASGAAVPSCKKKSSPTSPDQNDDKPQPGSARVAVADVQSYGRAELKAALITMFDQIGGLSDIIRPGDTVGMKVNLTGGTGSLGSYADTACETFWTHPEVARAVGELAKDTGASKIYIVEAVYDWDSYTDYGYDTVANYLGGQLVDLNSPNPHSAYAVRNVGDGWLIYQTLKQNAVLDECDCFISLPKAKRHKGAGVTHAMKNLVGTLPVPVGLYNAGASNRSAIHQIRKYDGNVNSNLCRVIIDLNLATRIHLAVTDAIKTVLGSEGPWNRDFRPASFNRLIASKDVVAADSVATKIIGFDPMASDLTVPFPDSINYLKLATEKGLGQYDLSRIEVLGTPIS
ncbi:DUF362 domain-containing protein [bacterium]|nr:DUF362 domain-containing protein [bacterium]